MSNENLTIPTRQTLLSRLKDWSDQDSWKDFFDTYWRLIYLTALKCGLTEAEAQDVVQETVISACKMMPSFHYDRRKGSFRGWLLQITRRRIADQLRKREPAISLDAPWEAGDQKTDLAETIPNPWEQDMQSFWEQNWQENLVNAALDRVKKRADPDQFQLFDLYVLQKWPVQKICQSLQIGRGRVYLAKFRIARMIKKEINGLESHLR